MCYESAITSVGGDEATLTKSLIISLEDVVANWYFRLPPKCIFSWEKLKEKFLLNFQGFQAELGTEEDLLSCAQYEMETLPNFYIRFLQLKAQALEVSDNQVIAQARKALCVGPLHSHLVRERPKSVAELYEFAKFSKSEVQHFCKLEQQRKMPNMTKPQGHIATMTINAATPSKYIALTPAVVGLRGTGRRISGHPRKKRSQSTFDYRSNQYN
jgi:hypothetical protein